MMIYDISFSSPVDNILFDDVLLTQADQGMIGDTLRLWESPCVCAVLGRVSRALDDLNIDGCHRDHVPMIRRSSGGGTVLQGPGCLNFSFVLSKQAHPLLQDLHRSYQEILMPVIQLLARLGIDAVFHPISDLALAANHKKFSGNAQRRTKNFILHHGTILYGFDLALMEQYLRFPKQVPEYRAGRSHTDFVANVNVDGAALKTAFFDSFSSGQTITSLSSVDEQMLAERTQAYRSGPTATEMF